MKCDIIIPVWNEPAATKECIDSIRASTGDYPYRLIIIDNGSAPETAGYLRSLTSVPGLEVKLIRNAENTGFVKATNQGIRASDAPYLCLMNNDTIATDGWLPELIRILGYGADIGIVNPSSNTMGQHIPPGRQLREFAAELKRYKGEIQELYSCRGFCMVMKREVAEKVGFLDERYDIGYFEETDYCKRAHNAGFRMARAKASYVYHKENTTFKNLKNNRDVFLKNEKLFFQRWGRALRVAYLYDDNSAAATVSGIALDIARSGHRIDIFIRRSGKWPVTADHLSVRRIDVNDIFANTIFLYKILKRKKEKRFDLVLTDNDGLGKMLRAFYHIHGTDVIIKPERDAVYDFLSRRSKVREL